MTQQTPLTVICQPCKHEWVVAQMPITITNFCKAIKGLTCPNCSADNKQICVKQGGSMSKLDLPLDPEGQAYSSMSLGDKGRFKYAAACRGRIMFTNSKKRWKRHYRAASKRKLCGTWFIQREGIFRFHWIRLTQGAL